MIIPILTPEFKAALKDKLKTRSLRFATVVSVTCTDDADTWLSLNSTYMGYKTKRSSGYWTGSTTDAYCILTPSGWKVLKPSRFMLVSELQVTINEL